MNDSDQKIIPTDNQAALNCNCNGATGNVESVWPSSSQEIEQSVVTLLPTIPNGERQEISSLSSILLKALLESLSEGVLVVNSEGRILQANEAAAQITQVKREELPGKFFQESFCYLDEKTGEAIRNPIQAAFAYQTKFKTRFCLTLVTPKGSEVSVKMTAFPLPDSPDSSLTVILLENITKLRNLSRQLHWQGNHDPITGLVNRIYFEDVIAQVLHQIKRNRQTYVLAHIDIDNFKVINDTCGNIAGDQLLGQLAVELQGKIRSVDALARLGGDEFGILFHQCSLSEAYDVVEQLQTDLENFRYVWQGKSLEVSVSIGLVQLDEETSDVEIALSKADTACYTAKNRGRNRIQMFSSRDVAIEDLKRHQEWNFLIREALDDNRFYLYRQPIVGIDRLDDFPHHYEILIRMVNAEGIVIAPNRFIPTAERYQLMPAIDRWVIGQSLSRLEALAHHDSNQCFNTSAKYAINLSGASLSDENFLAELIDRISQGGVAYNKLCFEITETAAITNLQQVNRFMTTLKQMGCRFSLDDFGAGMSSFGYLSSLPVDFVKIDGKFIQYLEADPSNVTIVESIVHVSKSLGLMTIAERVEDKSTALRLRDIGVDFIQGYGVGRPHRWI